MTYVIFAVILRFALDQLENDIHSKFMYKIQNNILTYSEGHFSTEVDGNINNWGLVGG